MLRPASPAAEGFKFVPQFEEIKILTPLLIKILPTIIKVNSSTTVGLN
jgi:hypothetical protein